MGEYTYEQYLEQWDYWIGEGTTGTYTKHFVTKLGPEQFMQKLHQLEALQKETEELQRSDDYSLGTDTWNKVEMLMAQSFPLEVDLFV
jgi:hypothetical protein